MHEQEEIKKRHEHDRKKSINRWIKEKEKIQVVKKAEEKARTKREKMIKANKDK